MKIVKLNRRFKRFKEAKHTVALRFDSWGSPALAVEQVCRDRFGSMFANGASWEGYFGTAKTVGPNPYWISFRNEKDLTLVLLSVNLTQNG